MPRASFSDKHAYQKAQTINRVSSEILAGNYANYTNLIDIFSSNALIQAIKNESALHIFVQDLHTYCNAQADSNDSHALCLVGFLYSFGIGCEQNHQQALTCLDKAIALNNDYAMYGRAYLHETGHGEPVSYPEVIRLYEQAIECGNPYAMFNRAYMHEMGHSGPVNYLQAIRLYECALTCKHS